MLFSAALLINPTKRSLTRSEIRSPAVDVNKLYGSTSRMDASLMRRGEEMTSQLICVGRKVILLCRKKKSVSPLLHTVTPLLRHGITFDFELLLSGLIGVEIF
jgi:hypothetical protein